MKGKKMKMKLKVGDMVIVLTGKDAGKTGKITQVIPSTEKVVVEGINKMIKHLRSPRRGEKGQRIEFFGPIHVSNVQMIDPETQKPTRISIEIVQGEDGTKQKIRKSKKSNATF